MKISTINKYFNKIYIDKYSPGGLSEKRIYDYELYGSYYLQNDQIGLNILKNYRKKVIYSNILGIIVIIISLFYIVLIGLYPIFYSFFDEIPFFHSIKFLSFGLIDFMHNLKWYWILGIHFIAIFVIGGGSAEIDNLIDSYESKKKLRKYLLMLLEKNLINKKSVKKKVVRKVVTEMKNKINKSTKNIFIVHGHDNLPIERTARFIEKIGLNPIILHEQTSEGKTIIEKFEKHSDVAFAVVLLTPDDEIYNRPDQPSKYRARQNVVFEFGYLMAKLGRNRVCALVKDSVELPSDINGIVYIPLDKNGAWKMKISKEMKAAKIEANYSAIL